MEKPEQFTNPAGWKADSQRFDGVAGQYDIYRPSYPVEMVEDVLLLSGIQPDGNILEIGSGTGKATLLFAPRGYSIACLEPGQNLVEVAARNLAAYPGVRFFQARFEDWEPGQEQFDLIFSAQAFHWVPENARYEKTSRLLKPNGSLALIWNMYPGGLGAVREALDKVYRDYAPELTTPEPNIEEIIERQTSALRESPYYGNVVVRRYPWAVRYETNAYLGLLNTYSDHLRLPEEQRRVLFDKIAEQVDRHGGAIERPYLTVLYMAQKRAM